MRPLFLQRRLKVKKTSVYSNNSRRRNQRRPKLSSRSLVNQIRRRVWSGLLRARHLRDIVMGLERTWALQPQVKVREVSRRKERRRAPAWLANQLSIRRMGNSTVSNPPSGSKRSHRSLVRAVLAKSMLWPLASAACSKSITTITIHRVATMFGSASSASTKASLARLPKL